MLNFGSFINISKILLLNLCISLILYGISLLLKLILTKTNNSKIWDNYISKFYTMFIFIISAIVYWIVGATKHIDSSFTNGILNGLILTGIESCMFRICKIVIDSFKKIVKK